MVAVVAENQKLKSMTGYYTSQKIGVPSSKPKLLLYDR